MQQRSNIGVKECRGPVRTVDRTPQRSTSKRNQTNDTIKGTRIAPLQAVKSGLLHSSRKFFLWTSSFIIVVDWNSILRLSHNFTIIKGMKCWLHSCIHNARAKSPRVNCIQKSYLRWLAKMRYSGCPSSKLHFQNCSVAENTDLKFMFLCFTEKMADLHYGASVPAEPNEKKIETCIFVSGLYPLCSNPWLLPRKGLTTAMKIVTNRTGGGGAGAHPRSGQPIGLDKRLFYFCRG